jgi:hypothetical protein
MRVFAEMSSQIRPGAGISVQADGLLPRWRHIGMTPAALAPGPESVFYDSRIWHGVVEGEANLGEEVDGVSGLVLRGSAPVGVFDYQAVVTGTLRFVFRVSHRDSVNQPGVALWALPGNGPVWKTTTAWLCPCSHGRSDKTTLW